MKRINWVVLATILTAITQCKLVYAQNGQKYSNEFLSIGNGARAHAMGSTQVSFVDDIFASYWNPAGLASIKSDMQIGAMHASMLGGVNNYDYLGVAMPLKDTTRVIGISAVRLGVDNIPNTLNLFDADGAINYANIEAFSASDYAFFGSYAQQFKEGKINAGANVKMIYRSVGSFAKAYGFGIDLGAQYKLSKSISVGFLAQDITSTFNAWKFSFTEKEKEVLQLTDNIIPKNSVELTLPKLILGATYRKDMKNIGFLASTDMFISTDGKRNSLVSSSIASIDPRVGLEFNYKKTIYLRAGLSNSQYIVTENAQKSLKLQPSAGIGIRIYGLHLDYAFTKNNAIFDGEYSHIVSMYLDLNYANIKRMLKQNK